MEWLKNLFKSKKQREYEAQRAEFLRNERKRAEQGRRAQPPRPIRGTHPRRVVDDEIITNYSNPASPLHPIYNYDADASDARSDSGGYSGSDSSGSDYSGGSDAGGGGFDGGSY